MEGNADRRRTICLKLSTFTGFMAAVEGARQSAMPLLRLPELIMYYLWVMWGLALFVFLESYATDPMRQRYGSVTYFMFHFVMTFFAGPLAYCPLFTFLSVYWYYH
jgi:hypothetical protein